MKLKYFNSYQFFLIDQSFISIPQLELRKFNDNRLCNWQAIMKMSQTIWKKWKNDYLAHLQQRIKWLVENENLG